MDRTKEHHRRPGSPDYWHKKSHEDKRRVNRPDVVVKKEPLSDNESLSPNISIKKVKADPDRPIKPDPDRPQRYKPTPEHKANFSPDRIERDEKERNEREYRHKRDRDNRRRDDSRRRRHDEDRDRRNRHYEERRRRRDDRDERRYNDEKRWQNRKRRIKEEEGAENFKFGKSEPDEKEVKKEKEKPNLEVTGKLAEDTNTFKGVVIKYNEPPEAAKPKRFWRLYPFKGDEQLKVMHLHRQSAFLFGKLRMIADIPIDHPSCSKQHAVLQYRRVPYTRPDGTTGQRVRPYIIDLDSANGTLLNDVKIESRKYHELHEMDVIKFGYSSREYVMMHDKMDTKDVEDDDDDEVEEDDSEEEESKEKS